MEEMFDITNWLEQVNDEDVNFVGSVFKLLLSMVLGAMVGLERRRYRGFQMSLYKSIRGLL